MDALPFAYSPSLKNSKLQNSPYAAFVDSRTVAAPLAQFDSWAMKVLSAWSNSIPRGGQGSGCEVGDPDSDHDGICDHKDHYPHDSSHW